MIGKYTYCLQPKYEINVNEQVNKSLEPKH